MKSFDESSFIILKPLKDCRIKDLLISRAEWFESGYVIKADNGTQPVNSQTYSRVMDSNIEKMILSEWSGANAVSGKPVVTSGMVRYFSKAVFLQPL